LTRKRGKCSIGLCVILACFPACSVVVDSNRVQCSTTSDCVARGADFAGSTCVESVCVPEAKWRCLDEPIKTELGSGPYRAPFIVQHLVTQAPLSGISARLCRKIDVKCSDPVSDVLETDAAGEVTFDVAAGFDGYAYFDGPDIIPGLYFFNPAVSADLPQAMVSIGPPEVIQLLALQAGATQAPERAVVLLVARDCTGAPAAGVSFKTSGADKASIPFYSEQNLPSGGAEETDAAGYGGLLNAGAGSITFTATINETGRRLGQVTILSREGSITYGSIVPDGS
jgi:hypothetical protein